MSMYSAVSVTNKSLGKRTSTLVRAMREVAQVGQYSTMLMCLHCLRLQYRKH